MTLIAWAAVLAEKGGSIQLTFPFHNVNIGVKLKAALKDSSQKFFNLSYSASYKKTLWSYLGNQIKVDEAKFTVELNQQVDELIDCFEIRNSTPVSSYTRRLWHIVSQVRT